MSCSSSERDCSSKGTIRSSIPHLKINFREKKVKVQNPTNHPVAYILLYAQYLECYNIAEKYRYFNDISTVPPPRSTVNLKTVWLKTGALPLSYVARALFLLRDTPTVSAARGKHCVLPQFPLVNRFPSTLLVQLAVSPRYYRGA